MNYHNITYPDMNNGSGLRVVLWLSGCSHHCKNCQNQQTWDQNSGIIFSEEAKKELFEELSKDHISGITFTGGDPLHSNNVSEVISIMDDVRQLHPDKTIWLYSGYTWEQLHDERDNMNYLRRLAVSKSDVFVDGPFVESLKDIALEWRGSSNQRVIDVKKSLDAGHVVLWHGSDE